MCVTLHAVGNKLQLKITLLFLQCMSFPAVISDSFYQLYLVTVQWNLALYKGHSEIRTPLY